MADENASKLENVSVKIATILPWAALIISAIASWFIGETWSRLDRLEAQVHQIDIKTIVNENRIENIKERMK